MMGLPYFAGPHFAGPHFAGPPLQEFFAISV
jgi:hypothetical protein